VRDPNEHAAMLRLWDREWGDRRQELAIIGIGLDEDAVREDLDACLLNAREMAQGPRAWANFPDPFPRWQR
jgi:hypothetical protein